MSNQELAAGGGIIGLILGFIAAIWKFISGGGLIF